MWALNELWKRSRHPKSPSGSQGFSDGPISSFKESNAWCFLFRTVCNLSVIDTKQPESWGGGGKQEEEKRAACPQACPPPPFRGCVLTLSSDLVASGRRAEVEWRFTHLSACRRWGTSGHRGFSKEMLGARGLSPQRGGFHSRVGRLYF